ncbi:hypothetical protein E7V67_011350 [[Empedobacter] haloabium]|uniref:Uncharacterized protein n=1 Tax=[Empedobacter] haloabium TaxID=592317 RepID=A0ABZ1USG8_9BURK
MIRAETVTVYHGGGRRWLTLKAAARREAAAAVRKRYPCQCERAEYDFGGAMVYPGLSCIHHSGDARFDKMVRRMARLHVAAFRATTQTESEKP